MDFQTNIRPLSIFAGYMTAAVVLTCKSLSVIVQQKALLRGRGRGRPVQDALPRGKLLLFASLALLSLATTWYYMFAFFHWSYQEWSATHPPLAAPTAGPRLGFWLRDTSLFKLAWGSAMETDARFWWTQQIFGFTALWSLMLADKGRHRIVRGAWIFMILGQIVAISFASNLSFLAMLLGPESKRTPSPGSERVGPFLYIVSVVNFACVAAIPYTRDEPYFLSVLLMPHVLAFLPMLLTAWWPENKRSSTLISPKVVVFALAVLLQAYTTSRMINQGGSLADILSAFHQHPAVTSVSWDVTLCWISYGAWYLLGA